jgi:alpha-N-arabinofuranosidase
MKKQAVALTIDTTRATGKVSPLHYGLMTEEINYSYDGGLYAELIRNRAFLNDSRGPAHWSSVGGAALQLTGERPYGDALPKSLQITCATANSGVANDGYWGFPITPKTRYRATLLARGDVGGLTLSLQSRDGRTVYARTRLSGLAEGWKKLTATLATGNVTPTTDAVFTVVTEKPGTLWLSQVSLFPPTWKNRPNGFRRDLMQLLVDLKPAFLRFPGGNYLEGNTIAERFDWKKTLGPIETRPGHPCPWGYRSTDGMGLLEFLLWCEAMEAEPVLGVYAGYSLRGEFVKPGPDLEPYIQDALDEIEYVTGSTSTKWGAQRARDGHPRPFKLGYVEIGNEDFFDRSGSYDGRFAQFYDAIKKKYPHLKVVSTVGNEQPASKRVTSRRPDALDEHYYRKAADFIRDSPTHFDRYDRSGPEIFVGEWGAHEEVAPWLPPSRSLPATPSMKAALGDAAFMTAMERHADFVTMQCYAPLFVNVNPGGRQWRPNLIGYDALRSYGSPSYHALKLFSTSVGDALLKIELSGAPLLASATRQSKTGKIFLKYVNPTETPHAVTIRLIGVRAVRPEAMVTTLAAHPDETNSLENPTKVLPKTTTLTGVKPEFVHTFPPHSISLLTLETR